MHAGLEREMLGSVANALTRVAGGRTGARVAPRRIVVDVREFMSTLPAVLHQQVTTCGLLCCYAKGRPFSAVMVQGR